MAEKAGIPIQTYKKYESDKITPGGDALASLGLLGIDLTWLLTGRSGEVSTEDYARIPLYDTRLVSGQASFAEAAPSRQAFLVPTGWPHEYVVANLAFIYMHGDAMLPTLANGDLLLVNRTEHPDPKAPDTKAVDTNGIYTFFVSGFLYIQRLERTMGGGVVCFKEDDPTRTPVPFIDLGGFTERTGIYGRVIWFGRKL